MQFVYVNAIISHANVISFNIKIFNEKNLFAAKNSVSYNIT